MPKNSGKSLQERDLQAIWHPLTQHQTASPPIAISKAKDALFWDEDGKEYIDGIASWYTAMYGHCNDHIISAVSQQLRELDQVVFTGFTHKPAVNLAEKLLEILPKNQAKIFFNDNGSTAIEAGIKMALQYHFNKGEKRDVLIAFENGFHGDTFGAMSASGLAVYNGPFQDFSLKVKRIPPPTNENVREVMASLKSIMADNLCAAIVYEPLIQGAAGMKFHDKEALEQVLKICHENKVITIADEVMTGFGKTGKHFSSLYLDVSPNIICLAKSLTAGISPMSITSCSQEIYDAFLDDEIGKAFFHAHTYSANPVGCAAAIAGIELLLSEEIQENITRIQNAHWEFKQRLSQHSNISEVRTMGVILAIDLNVEMTRYGKLRNQLFNHFMDKGIFLRPLGNTIYILPPFVITEKQLKKIYDSIEEAIALV
ncbi:MAG: adenosylmethionine--8-amino-7-oxononanoate transaminase [Flavobacteriaceae bacterium]|nr:adenosylmethionine--8-amino-7-oxononanoate transaminase [Flavobacteriaceae bacterium]